MKNNNYYLQLAQKYFTAELSPVEEIRLKRFLAMTNDPRFEDIKAVMGYLAIEKRLHADRTPKTSHIKYYLATTLAAAGLIIGLIPLSGPEVYMHKANGIETSNKVLVMDAVEGVLSDFFSKDTEIDIILNDYFNTGKI